MKPIDRLNRYAPSLTLLVVVCGLVWNAAKWNAEFEAVKTELAEVRDDVRVVQREVRVMREALPHLVSCVSDLHRLWTITVRLLSDEVREPGGGNTLLNDMPASCGEFRRQIAAQGG